MNFPSDSSGQPSHSQQDGQIYPMLAQLSLGWDQGKGWAVACSSSLGKWSNIRWDHPSANLTECPDDFLNRLTQLLGVRKLHRITKVPLCAHVFTAKSLGYVDKANKTLALAQTMFHKLEEATSCLYLCFTEAEGEQW